MAAGSGVSSQPAATQRRPATEPGPDRRIEPGFLRPTPSRAVRLANTYRAERGRADRR